MDERHQPRDRPRRTRCYPHRCPPLIFWTVYCLLVCDFVFTPYAISTYVSILIQLIHHLYNPCYNPVRRPMLPLPLAVRTVYIWNVHISYREWENAFLSSAFCTLNWHKPTILCEKRRVFMISIVRSRLRVGDIVYLRQTVKSQTHI